MTAADPDYLGAGPAAWLRNSLRHWSAEMRAKAKSARALGARNANMTTAAEHLARAYDDAAARFEAALDGVRT